MITGHVETDYVTLMGITAALIELVKTLDPENLWQRYYPVASCGIGFALGVATGSNWLLALTIGLAASGTYNMVKHTVLNK